MENTTPENNSTSHESKSYVNVKFKKPKPLTIAIGVAVILIVAALFFAKGIFVAATVNGSPVSRLSVIQELEKRGGKSTLDALITEKLIQNEAQAKGVTVTDAELDEEIKKIEAQVTTQGGTLADALAQQGMTEESFRKQVRTQKEVEKMLADKITVTDEEVQKYITDSKITIPKGEEEKTKEQIKDQLKDQKMGQEAQLLVTNLKNSAKIKYYVNY